jgi:hypothetical protein
MKFSHEDFKVQVHFYGLIVRVIRLYLSNSKIFYL